MPLSKYDRYYHGGAAKAMRNMQREYGTKKGKRVFYALKNKRMKQMQRS